MDEVRHTPDMGAEREAFDGWWEGLTTESLIFKNRHEIAWLSWQARADALAARETALKEIVATAEEYKAMPTKSLLDRMLSAINDGSAAISKATGGGQ